MPGGQVILLAEDLEQTDSVAGTPLDRADRDAGTDDGGSDTNHRDLRGGDAAGNGGQIDGRNVGTGGSRDSESRTRGDHGAAVILEDRDALASDVESITEDGHMRVCCVFPESVLHPVTKPRLEQTHGPAERPTEAERPDQV